MLNGFYLFNNSIKYTKTSGTKKWTVSAKVRILDSYETIFADGETKEKALLNLVQTIGCFVSVAYDEKEAA